ncbi:MAG: NUDIX hydrolase [Lentisphaeria bacterium]|jgi:ADP-ribose pyrophosphatase|nr:NUDIX hydrolase [Lentisphaeria bacterium]
MGRSAFPRVTGEKVIAKTKFLEFKELSYLNKFGDERRWSLVSRVGGSRAVMIVPFYGEKLVVTREFRVPVGGWCYSFPAGLIDDGEDAAAAAERELREETGLNLAEILAVSRPVFNSPGLTDEAVTMVYARVDGTPSREHLEADEDIETLFLDREQVVALMNDEKCFIGAKAWIEFYHFVNGK